LPVGELVALDHVGGNAPHGYTELALLRLRLLTGFLLFAKAAGKELGAVGDRHLRCRFLAIADIAKLGVGSRLQAEISATSSSPFLTCLPFTETMVSPV